MNNFLHIYIYSDIFNELLSFQHLEVDDSEGLHDTKESIKILFDVLKDILVGKPKEVLLEVLKTTIERKDRARGCDYREALLDLTVQLNGVCSREQFQLLRTLCEVCRLVYLPAEERNEKEVLRLLNTSYIYGVLLQRVAPASCKKLTWRKIFGIYYHAITTHMPITFKYIALSSLNAEDDERQFSTINSISRGTSNRKSDHILSNSIIRMQAEKRC